MEKLSKLIDESEDRISAIVGIVGILGILGNIGIGGGQVVRSSEFGVLLFWDCGV